jgi:hypothetical protein
MSVTHTVRAPTAPEQIGAAQRPGQLVRTCAFPLGMYGSVGFLLARSTERNLASHRENVLFRASDTDECDERVLGRLL